MCRWHARMPAAPVVSSPVSREKLLQVARSLPADLQVLSQLGEMLQDVNSELHEVAGLLRRDVALATRIVRIGNSPVFGGGGQVASTEEAVNRVGFGEILKLVGTASAARLTDRALDFYGVPAELLGDNMLYCASAAETLARATGADMRVAYTAGLLRPLGLMVLDRACRGQLAPAQAFAADRWSSYAVWEGGLFGLSSSEVAALILEEWRFPTALTTAIRNHHLARPADAEHDLAVILNLAAGLAERSGRGFPGEACWWDLSAQRLGLIGATEEHLAPTLAAVEESFVAAKRAMKA